MNEFAQNKQARYNYDSRAVIVPHAGLVYSGQLAYCGIDQLDKNIKSIFIFAPAHRVAFEGLALTGYDEWQTPLGNIKINQDINKELQEKFDAKIFDEALKDEHSIEIEVPLIQKIFKDVKIIPVLVGRENQNKIKAIIGEYYPNIDFGFIISSDLSHFLEDEQAKIKDNATAAMIETGDISNFKYEQACGAVGICGLVEFAKSKEYSLIRINMENSSSTTGDKTRVVGYGSWFLYEGNKNRLIKECCSGYVLKLCRDVILHNFSKEKLYTNHLPIFNELGACFVTLKKENILRGCIGSIIAHQPLIVDLIQNSQNAAFRDPRFMPVEENEINDIKISVSLLSHPIKIHFKDENDLLEQMVPDRDGIIIRDGAKQGVYLPVVWEDIPDKARFLQSLKMKVGMSPDYFSDTFEAYRFEAIYLSENS